MIVPVVLCIATPAGGQDRRPTTPPAPNKQLPGAYLPSRFTIYIGGGIFPPNYTVELRGRSLVYHSQERDPKTDAARERTRIVTPTADQWRRFWRTMDQIKLWDWLAEYPNPLVADGTHWDLDIAFGDRRIKSSGSNAYPGGTNKPPDLSRPETLAPGTTRVFETYLNAVKVLVDGEPFR
jgi:hypothetical protein